MTPEAFHTSILPCVYGALSERCLCAHPGFRKLLSFNFEDYSTSPMAMIDSEFIIDCFLRHGLCRQIGDFGRNANGDGVQNYECLQCGGSIAEYYEEYSISMYRSYCRFDETVAPNPRGLYLVGVRYFDLKEIEKIHDFTITESTSQFLDSIGIDEQTVAPKPPPVRY
jgi:hypothetical protein